MTRVVRTFALLVFVLSSLPAMAQSPYTGSGYEMPPECVPYDILGCSGAGLTPAENPITSPGAPQFVGEPPKDYDFAQVWIGVEGQPNDYLVYVSITNKTTEIMTATIEVRLEGRDMITRTYPVIPGNGRISPRLNDWPELAGIQAGISVTVRVNRAATVGVGMHPASDFFGPRAKILEGR